MVIDELRPAWSSCRAEADHPLFNRVASAWADDPAGEPATGVALDVALIHIASMSNLFAALGWYLIDLLAHPEEAARVRAATGTWPKLRLESIRLAQRSIMARYVLAPVVLDVGPARHEVSAGATVATLLPLTNASAPRASTAGTRTTGAGGGWPMARGSTPSSWSPPSDTGGTPARPSPSRCRP